MASAEATGAATDVLIASNRTGRLYAGRHTQRSIVTVMSPLVKTAVVAPMSKECLQKAGSLRARVMQ